MWFLVLRMHCGFESCMRAHAISFVYSEGLFGGGPLMQDDSISPGDGRRGEWRSDFK